MSLKKKRSKIIPIEDLIVKILVKFPKARLIEAIPIIIIKNRIDNLEHSINDKLNNIENLMRR